MKSAVLAVSAVLLGAFLAHADAPKPAAKVTYKIVGANGNVAETQKTFDELASYGYRFAGELPGGNLAFEKTAQ